MEIFYENCINTIGKDLVNLLDPRYLEVWGNLHWGGISTDPYYNHGRPGTKYEGLAEQRLFQHDPIQRKLTIANTLRKSLQTASTSPCCRYG